MDTEQEIIDDVEVPEAAPETVKEPESLRESIQKAKVEVAEKAESTRDEKGKFKGKLELPAEGKSALKIATKPEEEKPEVQAPTSWKAADKQMWKDVPAPLQQAILQREKEVHEGFTRLDEDRQLGKQIKDVVSPYLATIRAEGGTPVTAVADLLNTAHILRTGTPQQKAQAIQQAIHQFGVDTRLFGQPQQAVNPEIAALQQQIANLTSERNQEKTLLQQEQDAKVTFKVNEFASDPKNEFFPQVKAHMAALLKSGLEEYQTLEQAYEAAVLANPVTRALSLQKSQAKPNPVEAKKRAAVSISGSSSKSSANAENPNRSLREELQANFRSASLD